MGRTGRDGGMIGPPEAIRSGGFTLAPGLPAR